MKKLLITGSNGFIGKNLLFALQDYKVFLYDKDYTYEYLYLVLEDVDFIFHLASGIKDGFDTTLSQFIFSSLDKHENYPPVIYTSSILAGGDTAHGRYKRLEEELWKFYKGKVYIYRLPNVFGRWAKPEYNSVVATFLFNQFCGKEFRIDDPDRSAPPLDIRAIVKGAFAAAIGAGNDPQQRPLRFARSRFRHHACPCVPSGCAERWRGTPPANRAAAFRCRISPPSAAPSPHSARAPAWSEDRWSERILSGWPST